MFQDCQENRETDDNNHHYDQNRAGKKGKKNKNICLPFFMAKVGGCKREKKKRKANRKKGEVIESLTAFGFSLK